MHNCRRCNKSLYACSRGARGLCGKCYQILYHAVKDGTTTWEKLEAAGLAAPPKKPKSTWPYKAFTGG